MNLLDPIEWSILLMVAGCGLLVLEVFIPSGGIISFFAAISLVASLVIAYRRDLTTGLAFTTVAVFAVPLAIALALKIWPQTPMGKSFLGELPSEEETAPDDPRRALIGKTGVAQSKMLPSGAVMIDGKIIDAISTGVAIEKGDNIVVTEVQANRVMVRPERSTAKTTDDEATDSLLDRPIQDFGLESIDEPLA